MIEPIEDMPAGTVGFRVSGVLERSDYVDVLEPAVAKALEAGDMRMLFELSEDLDHIAAGAILEDAKMGLSLEVGHHADWKRAAIVTDLGWVRGAMRAFGWMAPGKMRSFPVDAIEEAKLWVASDDSG